jgi:hypothetical protein
MEGWPILNGSVVRVRCSEALAANAVIGGGRDAGHGWLSATVNRFRQGSVALPAHRRRSALPRAQLGASVQQLGRHGSPPSRSPVVPATPAATRLRRHVRRRSAHGLSHRPQCCAPSASNQSLQATRQQVRSLGVTARVSARSRRRVGCRVA